MPYIFLLIIIFEKNSYMVMIINKKTSKRSLEKFLKSKSRTKIFNAKKHFGAVRFSEDALTIQKRLRNEWE